MLGQNKVFGGWHQQYSFNSSCLNSVTRFAIFLPPDASDSSPVPVLYWLSGLTCTDENFMQKAGAFKVAAELGIAVVAPDTSPRGELVPDDPDGAYDFGQGAGFYLNATQAPWDEHYHMYDFVLEELPNVIESAFPVTAKRALSGHSMGGHGALMIALRNPALFSSVSAFSPIANPSEVPWGQKAFSNYLGNDKSQWLQYDACHLLDMSAQKSPQNRKVPALVDQGDKDPFLATQLSTDKLQRAVEQSGYPMQIRMQEGYDHSYYFIASFIEEHLKFHAQYLF
mgnify:CR=1 FL=1